MPVEFRTGRPPHWNNCLDLDAMCELYFEECEENGKHPGVCGLALFLGVDRKTITDYQQKDEFSHIVKRFKQRVEAHIEQHLFGGAVTGLIFNLKNNFGWKDQQQIEQTGKDGGPIKTENKVVYEFVNADTDSKEA